jgi:benzoyl-CoA reductase/2-hydroxyglutaryl-CoA dehydratase subunit BcrC/BadD/HgdB
MSARIRSLTLDGWDARYSALRRGDMAEASYGGPLRRHLDDGDARLASLRYDPSAAALRLWNFLLTEEDRLRAARAAGKKIVGAMKDLGTVPVMAYSLPDIVAFYPDGAWWLPCVMEMSGKALAAADRLGVNETFCPVRAMLGAFVTEEHFPIPDLLTCSVGATCDDFSAIAQRLAGLGHDILWWEVPNRRKPDPGEPAARLPGGLVAPASQVALVRQGLERVRAAIETLGGRRLDDDGLAAGIRAANGVRRTLRELRRLAYTAEPCPIPALEMLIAEMLAIHFCSDREEAGAVLAALLDEVRRRIAARRGVVDKGAVRVFWVNPVADLRAMNLLEEAGGRLCGTEYLFAHALDEVPEDLQPMEALARTALADVMVGPAADRARRVAREAAEFGAEAVVVARIPGASHCATEGAVIARAVEAALGLPVIEVEVPPLSDGVANGLRTRLEALIETVKERRMAGRRRSTSGKRNSAAGTGL